ncbi:MAG: M20/M25/M40 family metallo-hydrolase [Chloroflexota bacterium]|jgi:acetylornithine deacetylase/succinyl-diaminopimelate desuccinylase-like protein
MGAIRRLASNKKVKDALDTCPERVRPTLDLAIAIQQIPSPTFAEAERAAFVEGEFLKMGLADVSQDTMHNVFGRLPGRGRGGPVILSAHTDTVFDHEVDLTVRYEDGRKPSDTVISGPGLADNALGVAGLLALAELLIDGRLRPAADIWFVANVCEEGLGDLLGMRSVVERFGAAATYIVLEGGSFGHVFHKAIGVRRFRLTIKTPGGHSWGDYGSPNAIHVLSRIIERLDRIQLPEQPKTTINVGAIEGGTTVNTIAAQASCLIDMRSIEPAMLQRLVDSAERIARECTEEGDVSMTMTQIGNRPAGALPEDSAIVTWAAEALSQAGCREVRFMAGSTDANIPISMGIPSVCIGLANSGNTHRLDEFLDPKNLSRGLGQLLLLVLAAAGFDDDSLNEKE